MQALIFHLLFYCFVIDGLLRHHANHMRRRFVMPTGMASINICFVIIGSRCQMCFVIATPMHKASASNYLSCFQLSQFPINIYLSLFYHQSFPPLAHYQYNNKQFRTQHHFSLFTSSHHFGRQAHRSRRPSQQQQQQQYKELQRTLSVRKKVYSSRPSIAAISVGVYIVVVVVVVVVIKFVYF